MKNRQPPSVPTAPGCIEGIPCNPLNKTNMFGWQLPISDTFLNHSKNHLDFFFKVDKYYHPTIEQRILENQCDFICPKACFETTYTTEVQQYAREPITGELTRDQVIAIRYVNKVEHRQAVAATDAYTLVSSLGGVLGLFTGFSLLTLVEVVELLTDLSLLLCRRPTNDVTVTP